MTLSTPKFVVVVFTTTGTRTARRVLILTVLAFAFLVSSFTEAFPNPFLNNNNNNNNILSIQQQFQRLFFQKDASGENSNKDNNNNQNKNEKMRAWNCHGRNQRELVWHMRQAGIVQAPAVAKVLEQVDRANYIPKNPYMDAPQGIGLGQTISAPHMHAHVLEEIYPYLVAGKQAAGGESAAEHELKLLDVGSGSGYLTAALGRWIQPAPLSNDEQQDTAPILGGRGMRGKVFGLDVHSDLIDLSVRNLRKADGDLLDTGVVHIQRGDGWKGLPSEAPFDAIHVGAAADGMPNELVAQLKVGGVMIIPIGAQNEIQNLYKIERISRTDPVGSYDPNDYRITTLLGVRYVPLVRPPNTN